MFTHSPTPKKIFFIYLFSIDFRKNGAFRFLAAFTNGEVKSRDNQCQSTADPFTHTATHYYCVCVCLCVEWNRLWCPFRALLLANLSKWSMHLATSIDATWLAKMMKNEKRSFRARHVLGIKYPDRNSMSEAKGKRVFAPWFNGRTETLRYRREVAAVISA